MKRLVALLFICACLMGQRNSRALLLNSVTAGGGGTVDCGPSTHNNTDTGNANYAFATPCTTGANGSGYSVASLTVWIGTAASAGTTWGMAVYVGSTASTATLVCHVESTATQSANALNTLTPSGCGTLSASTTYWIAQYSASGTQQQGYQTGTCDSAYHSSVSMPSWPDPFGGSTFTSVCYEQYMTLNVL